MNITILRGTLAAAPIITELANGSQVHNFELHAHAGDARHVVPISWLDPTRPPKLAKGEEVVVVGAVRRRWFRAGGGSQSRTEVLASTVARPRSKGAERALESAVARVVESGSFG